MRVMVTGGTGFVGSHTVAELLRNGGHTVRLFVRSPERVGAALVPHRIGGVETVQGDVTDSEAVERGMRGCEAVIHCASVYSLDPRRDAEIRRTNVHGTQVVLESASRLGLDPIVHVSSISALYGPGGAVLGPDSSPTNPPGTYYRSKADSDRVARRLQGEGAPVVITYPGSVWGPYDPNYGESCQMAETALRRQFVVTLPGSAAFSDVREVARLHLAVLERRRGPRRYSATAQHLSAPGFLARLSRLTGRPLPNVALPPWAMLGPARVLDVLQRRLPFRLPFNFQLVYAFALDHRLDDALTRREFGIIPRDIDETLADTIRWMVRVGRLPAGLAGRLAAVPSVALSV